MVDSDSAKTANERVRIILRIVVTLTIGFLSGVGIWYGIPEPAGFILGLIIMISSVVIVDYIVLKNRWLL
ncbi:MAG TPA: hypothetical protein VE955_03870 [Candidatus Dormibacteraeota bacterium]|jgi:Kef-type K+ transport system membrane component KefB|nr:hypothetical protein [Candidatus Dormibacteraeota bacterium]